MTENKRSGTIGVDGQPTNPKERIEESQNAPSAPFGVFEVDDGEGEACSGWWLSAAGAEALQARVAVQEAAIAAGVLPPTTFDILARTRRCAWDALASWPTDRPIPDRVITEAFEYATGWPARARLPRDGRHRPALDRALTRYARYIDYRPDRDDGERWPESAPAALAWAMRDLADHTARDGEPPASPIYAIGRLNLITKQMAAEAKRQKPERELDGMQRRRSRLERAYTRGRIAFRSVQRSPRWGGSTEAHRRAAIDAALAGQLPGFGALHGFIVRGSDLLGRPNRDGRYPSGRSHYPDALRALQQLPLLLDEHGRAHHER